jgi:branched-chain amino acid transport system substrate-binding protein
MNHFTRRRTLVQAMGAASVLGPFVAGRASAQAPKGDIVIGASQPITGIFSFAGVAMNNAFNDYVAWKNAAGGVAGRKLRYVSEDSGFKLDQGVAIFKKIMAAEKPSFFFGDSTPWAKAVAQDAIASASVMTSGPSLAGAMADPKAMPHHFVPGSTYGQLHEVLMEYVARASRGAAAKPNIAYVYSDGEFGRDGIPAAKARAEKLGLNIGLEIVTRQAGVDVPPEVAKLRRFKPDIVVFQGYLVAPIPEFARQMREAGLSPQIMATAWALDRMTYEPLGALGTKLTGVSTYRYPHETADSPMMTIIRDNLAKVRPDQKHISPYYICAWLCGMVYSEVAERCIKANKPLTLANMKAALESMKSWDNGGLTGLLADLSGHQIASGRIYSYDLDKKAMEPASGWIKA